MAGFLKWLFGSGAGTTLRHLLERLRMAIRSNPGIPQNRIKAELGLDEGRRASRLSSYVEKSGEVRRAKNGKSFDLYIADASMPYPASRRHQGRA